MKKLFLLLLTTLSVVWSYSQTVNGNVIDVTCFGGNNGSIDITVTGGSGSYLYDWSNGADSEDISNLIAGDYTVTVTDNAKSLNSINTIRTFTVNQPTEIELEIMPSNESCYGANDASISVNVIQGGIAPFTYLWSNDSTTQEILNYNIDPLMGYEEFTVTVTDASSCSAISGGMINIAAEPDYNITTINSNCGNDDGEAFIDGLEGNYEITWVTGETGDHIYNLRAGLYTVEIHNLDVGCSIVKEFYIEDNTSATFTPTVIDASSPSANDGQISLAISGGTAPHIVVWDNAMAGNLNPNLYSGSYSATITDADGCLNTICVGVGSISPLEASIVGNNTTMCSGVNGSATVNTWGGISPYGYAWDDPNNQTGPTASNLTAGIYHCLITDVSGQHITKTIAIGDNGGPTVTWNGSGIEDCSQANGYINITASGGTGSLNYLWSNGSTSQNLTNVVEGQYELLVTDQTYPNACHTAFSEHVQGTRPMAQPICMVTVDSVTDHNLVVWENIQTEGIDHYNIYRDNCDNNFSYIGAVDASTISVFEDISSLPFVKSYAYKISAVDACGNESELSYMHKTIHLEIVLDEANHTAELIWDDYIGFANPIFKLYKKTTDQGWISLDDVINTEMSFTDIQYNDTTISYAIQVVHPNGGCDAWNGVSHVTGGPYYQSSSNIEDEGIVNHTVVEQINSNLSIYPNPSNGILNITNSEPIQSIKIIDISGKTISSYVKINQNNIKLNTQNFKPGIYILEIQASDLVRKQIIIE